MLHTYVSNSLEELAKGLSFLLRERKDPPLASPVILIQSRGMERWLSMKIAEENGICANIRFLFPNMLLYELFKIVLDDIPEDSFMDVEFMKWRLMKIIPEIIQDKNFSFFLRYLREEKRDLAIFQLCSLIADTFDQYIIFRPDLIFRWERGEEDHWQAHLFRVLIKETNGLHRARLSRIFAERVSEKKYKLPSNIYAFGISFLPRFHLDIINAVSKYIDVHMFLLNPCMEFWGDILPERHILRKGSSLKEELHMEIGNPLLSSLGKLGRDFFDIINEYDALVHENFKEIEENSLLSYIQADILRLRNPYQMEKRKIREDDLSIQIHSCHSPLREVEVLYDNILAMLDEDPSLKPRDILVMTPNIEKYAPFIQAVFGSPEPDSPKIPFSIADRSPKWENEVIRTFFKILRLKDSRFEASLIMDIIDSDPISKRFDFRKEDIRILRKWVREVGIRWGMDKEDRRKWLKIVSDTGTWRSGLNSLLLGYALVDEEKGVFEDIFPYDESEGNSDLLGRFIDLINKLFFYAKEFSRKKRIRQWQELFFSLLDELFFVDEESQRYMQLLKEIIAEMTESSENASFFDLVDIDVPVWNIEKALGRRGYGSRFLTGGITFCEMLPMRSIPFKVICLIGMNYDDFPRYFKTWEFDLIQKNPRKGDRSKRDDDRYLFLETIISARKRLYISYVGRSIKDNTPIPPSVVVSELMDYIEQGFYIEGKDILSHISFEHALHPFSPIYFKEERFFSYSNLNLLAAKNALSERRQRESFLKDLSENRIEEIELDDFFSFFSNPVKFLLKKRLNISLKKEIDQVEDMEIIRLKGLYKYRFDQELFKNRIKRERERFIEFMQSRGFLPLGAIGEYEFLKSKQKLDLFLKEISPYIEKEVEEVEIEKEINGIRIKGRIKDIYDGRLLLYRFSKVRPSDRIRLWLIYLFLRADEIPLKDVSLFGFDEKERLLSLKLGHIEKNEAEEYLRDMISIFKEGIRRPIHFFPKSSWEFAERIYIKKEDQGIAIQKAKEMWEGSEYKIGEKEDEYYEFCFRGIDPIDEEFVDLSKRIFLPIIINSERK